jgi:hypothetical protein
VDLVRVDDVDPQTPEGVLERPGVTLANLMPRTAPR